MSDVTSAREALSPEALADRIVPQDPRVSPDGDLVAFTALPHGRAGEHEASAIWLGRPGSPARKLTSGVAADRSPRWSPDGERLLFVSDRIEPGEKSGLFLLPMSGGEAE
ncbi:MAG: TolB family protein, partial [Thermomicrobiales bacterium]